MRTWIHFISHTKTECSIGWTFFFSGSSMVRSFPHTSCLTLSQRGPKRLLRSTTLCVHARVRVSRAALATAAELAWVMGLFNKNYLFINNNNTITHSPTHHSCGASCTCSWGADGLPDTWRPRPKKLNWRYDSEASMFLAISKAFLRFSYLFCFSGQAQQQVMWTKSWETQREKMQQNWDVAAKRADDSNPRLLSTSFSVSCVPCPKALVLTYPLLYTKLWYMYTISDKLVAWSHTGY